MMPGFNLQGYSLNQAVVVGRGILCVSTFLLRLDFFLVFGRALRVRGKGGWLIIYNDFGVSASFFVGSPFCRG